MTGSGAIGLSFDDALVKYVGQFGKAQVRLMLLASLLWIPNALLILVMVFHVSPNPIKEHWWQCSDSNNTVCLAAYNQTDPTTAFCKLDSTDWHWTHQSRSIISQFDLVCHNAWKSQLSNSAFFLGYLIGSGVFGTLSDVRGRKPVLFGCTALGAVFLLAAGIAPNYWLYFIFRLITGIGAAGQALTTYILATESVGPAWRGAAGVATQLFFIVGEFVLVLLAFLTRSWRALTFTCAAICFAALGLYPLLPESPRWLLVKGRKREATEVMTAMAAANRTAMPTEPLADAPVEEAGQKVSLSAVLQDRHILRRFLVLAYVWLVLCMTYYGISLALGGLPGSVYVTFMVASLAEFPSYIVAAYMIERVGRHNTMAAGMLLGGVSCLACAVCPPGAGQAALAALGKFGCAGAFTVASIFTSEMFPTLVRSAVLGAENEAARVGGIAAPFIVLLGTSSQRPALPFYVFGVSSFFGGLLIFTLPETLGTVLPDTLGDMEAIQSIFSTKPWRKGGWKQTLVEMFRARASPAPAAAASVPQVPATAMGAVGNGSGEQHHGGLHGVPEEEHSLLGGGAQRSDQGQLHQSHEGAPGNVAAST